MAKPRATARVVAEGRQERQATHWLGRAQGATRLHTGQWACKAKQGGVNQHTITEGLKVPLPRLHGVVGILIVGYKPHIHE